MTTTYELYTNENGTPKAVEGKAPAILERVEALEETLDKGVVTSVNGNTGDITPEQTGCLPTGGGMMSGAIVNTYGDLIRQKTTSGWTSIKGGTNDSTGGYFTNYGKDHSEKGKSIMGACDGVNTSRLSLSADGYLKLNGNRVPTLLNPFVPDYFSGVAITSGFVAPSAGVVVIRSQGYYAEATILWLNGINVGLQRTTDYMDSSVTAWVNKGLTVTFINGGSDAAAMFYPLAVGG